jgi:hypothetical protein
MIIRNSTISIKKLLGLLRLLQLRDPDNPEKQHWFAQLSLKGQYINLEDPEIRTFAIEDPKTFYLN